MGLFPQAIENYVAFQVPRGPNSQIFLVDPANGSDNNHGTSFNAPLASIEAAEALTVANQHDVVLYLAGASANNLAAAVTWDKNYTHLIGLCAPTQVAQRSRIMYETGTTAASPLLNITASGCIFKNFYIFHGIASATNLINVQVSGGRNYFENVHFAGGGHATQAIDDGASLRLVGSEGENTFVNCTIGVDTIAAATGMRALAIIGGTPRNIFRECNFTMYAGNSGAMFVEWEALSAVDRYMLFDRCNFINTGTSTMDAAFVMPAAAPAHRRCFLQDCWGYGFTDWDADDRGYLFLSGGTQTSGGTTGLYQASVVA